MAKKLNLFLFLVCVVFFSLTKAIDGPTYHLDGAFQTASGLFRLESGQLPGRDFLPYLGIGPLFALYPAYLVFGHNLFASVVAPQMATLLSGWIAISVILYLVLSPKFLDALAFGGSLTALTTVVALPLRHVSLPGLNALSFYVAPGNSMRPIRAVAPYLVAMFYLLVISRRVPSGAKPMVSGLATGLVLLWSNDFALPSALLLGVLTIFEAIREGRSITKALLTFGFFTLLSWAGLLSLATAGHPLEVLKYNFVDVARDQWWLFSDYQERYRIFGFTEIYKAFSADNLFPLFVLAINFLTLSRRRPISLHAALNPLIGLTLFLGGLIPCIGGHVGAYFSGFMFWGIFTFAFHGYKRLSLYIEAKGAVLWPWVSTGQRMLQPMSLLVLGIASVASVMAFQSSLSAARSDKHRFYVPELGAFLSEEWRDYIESARGSGDSEVIEEYWGIWSAARRKVSPWPVDSVIHALGNTREVARARLRDAEYIITTRYRESPEWQPWSLSQNYWLYDDLLSGWEPFKLSPATVVWRRSSAQRPFESIPCTPVNDGQALRLSPPAPGFYRVQLEYQFESTGKNLLFIKNNISYAADAHGYVSLKPADGKAVIPVYFSVPDDSLLPFTVYGSRQHKLKATSCSASKIGLTDPEVLHVPDPAATKVRPEGKRR